MRAAGPQQVRVALTGPQAAATTSAIVWPGRDPQAAGVILAHGAGTDMTHRHMRRHATDLVDAGHPTALFNFAFTEVGRKRPDPASRLQSAWRDVIDALRPRMGSGRKLVIGGRSMGGRIASMVAAASADELRIDGVACLAYPLHPAGRPHNLRVGHCPDLDVPIVFISGSRDALAPVVTMQDNIRSHVPDGLASFHVIEGADHSFHVRRSDAGSEDEALQDVADHLTAWLGDAL